MHLLVLPSWYPASPDDIKGVFFRDQVLALHAEGYRVGVIAPMLKSLRAVYSRRNRSNSENFEIDEGIPTYRMHQWALLPRVPFGNYFIWRSVANRLLDRYLAEQGRPDVIHAHSAIYAGAVAGEWRSTLKVPVVLTEHSTAYARSVFRPWQLRLARLAAIAADERISVSPPLGTLLEEQLGKNAGPWRWVPNVVAPRFHREQPLDLQSSREIRLLNLALMSDKKGQSDLLKGFARAFPNPSSVELWIGGDGPIRGRLKEEARSLDIGRRVRFLGMVPPDEVPGLLGVVDLMVVSSHYETFGVVAAEALMAGVPVVATQCGGPEYIVRDGDGLLVPPRSPDKLALALKEAVEQLENFDRAAIAARAWARFSGPAVVGQLGQLYRDILSERQP